MADADIPTGPVVVPQPFTPAGPATVATLSCEALGVAVQLIGTVKVLGPVTAAVKVE